MKLRTSRMGTAYIESRPQDGIPVVLVHDNVSTGRFYGHGGTKAEGSPCCPDWAGIVDLDPRPPILWTHGTEDIVVADGSPWEMGALGSMGAIPGWPGEDVSPPQPMVAQIRTVLERYPEAGGRAEIERFEGSGHFPPLDAAERRSTVLFEFLASVDS